MSDSVGGGAATRKRKITSVDQLSQKSAAPASSSKARVAETQAAFQDMTTNPFYVIMFDKELLPTDKAKAFSKAVTFPGDKEAARQSVEEFNTFKEWLQTERKRMAREVIDLTNTDAFSELKKVYAEINGDLLTFENNIKPLTDIIDAVHILRINDVGLDIFKEIQEDKKAEEEAKKELEEQQKRFEALSGQVNSLQQDNARLSEDRGFLGFGSVRKGSREQIVLNNLELEQRQEELAALTGVLEAGVAGKVNRTTNFEDYQTEKAKLRELLDISSEEHKDRQEALVESALTFINRTEERVGSVLEHIKGMNDQIEHLADANYQMREIYAIMNDGTHLANGENEKIRQTLSDGTESESEIQKMERDRKIRDIENHIAAFSSSTVDTSSSLAELTASENRIKAMKDTNEQQVTQTRALHTSGVAGVADQLSTVLQAVSAAALTEAGEGLRAGLHRMTNITQDVSNKSAIQAALGTQEINEDLEVALDNLLGYGETIKQTTNLQREGLAATKNILARLEKVAAEVQEGIKESVGVAADVLAGKGDSSPESSGVGEVPKKGPPSFTSSFDLK